MKQSINLTWLDKMAFETEINGHKIILDADEAVGGEDRGPRPKTLMMLSLAGCTAMDVVSILKKMRVEIDSFDVKIEGNLTEVHPKQFENMHIVYEFSGNELELKRDKIEKAINLSQERYCGVSASYRKAMELTSEIRITKN